MINFLFQRSTFHEYLSVVIDNLSSSTNSKDVIANYLVKYLVNHKFYKKTWRIKSVKKKFMLIFWALKQINIIIPFSYWTYLD